MSRASGRPAAKRTALHPKSKRVAMAVAHVGFTTAGRVGLLAVVLRYSSARWAWWVDFNADTATFGRALIHAATFFGGAPRRFVFEEADCRVLRWDGHCEHFAEILQAVAHHMGSSLALWHERYCGPATRVCEHLVWTTARPRQAELDAGNARLRAALRDTMPYLPHPQQPGRSIAEHFAEERVHLLPLPASWAALDVWFEAATDDDP
jgi:transposase